jgi:hypothetical protein
MLCISEHVSLFRIFEEVGRMEGKNFRHNDRFCAEFVIGFAPKNPKRVSDGKYS